MSVLICNPSKSIDAVLLPLTILFNCNPVTPVAGMLYKPAPSPLNDAVINPPFSMYMFEPLVNTNDALSFNKTFASLIPN